MSSYDSIEWVVTNVASLTIVVATFGYGHYIPAADQIVQWSLGLLVAATIIVFNVVRTLHYIKDLRRPRKRKEP